MRRAALPLFAASLIGAAPAPADLMTGTFSNEEQVYFDKEAGRTPPAWFAMHITPTKDGLLIEEPDIFGKVASAPHPLAVRKEGKLTVLDYGACERLYKMEQGAMVAAAVRGTCRAPGTITRVDSKAITLTFPDGKTSELRRARSVSCWVSVRKDKPKADGKEDWTFEPAVKLHDQGGRALIGAGVEGVKPVVIRMRNVTWAGSKSASNRPSLVLYVHTPDEPDKAISYVWGDEGAARLGINLRWMQASCTIEGAEKPSVITKTTFRG